MEIKDLSEVSLKDTGFYEGRALYTHLLKKYNITNVAQLLDDELVERILNESKSWENTKDAFKALVKLVNFKYLNIPLGDEEFLNYKIVRKIDAFRGSSDLGPIYDIEDENGVMHGWSCERFIYEMPYEFETAMLMKWHSKVDEMLDDSPLRIIDALKMIISENKVEDFTRIEYRVTLNIINAIVDSYEKKNGNVKLVVNPKTIAIFDDKITKLVKEKNAIDEAIVSLVRERDKIKTL